MMIGVVDLYGFESTIHSPPNQNAQTVRLDKGLRLMVDSISIFAFGENYCSHQFLNWWQQHAGGMLLPPVRKLVATIIFAKGENGNRIHHPNHHPPIRQDRGISLPFGILIIQEHQAL